MDFHKPKIPAVEGESALYEWFGEVRHYNLPLGEEDKGVIWVFRY